MVSALNLLDHYARKTNAYYAQLNEALLRLVNRRNSRVLDVGCGTGLHFPRKRILDSTHLRLFTRSSSVRLFRDAGYTIELVVPYFSGRPIRLSESLVREPSRQVARATVGDSARDDLNPSLQFERVSNAVLGVSTCQPHTTGG